MEQVDVTQADRDAAADLLQIMEPNPALMPLLAMLRQGKGDKDSPAVQAFARHRIEATRTNDQAKDEEIARLREALEKIHAWTNAYPTKIFKEPNLAAVRGLLEKNDMLVEMDRMHASWARDIVAHIAEVTGPALEPSNG